MTTQWNWRKSSRSATNGQCVEIGTSRDTPAIAIRDSKAADDSPMLITSRAQLDALLTMATES